MVRQKSDTRTVDLLALQYHTIGNNPSESSIKPDVPRADSHSKHWSPWGRLISPPPISELSEVQLSPARYSRLEEALSLVSRNTRNKFE